MCHLKTNTFLSLVPHQVHSKPNLCEVFMDVFCRLIKAEMLCSREEQERGEEEKMDEHGEQGCIKKHIEFLFPKVDLALTLEHLDKDRLIHK